MWNWECGIFQPNSIADILQAPVVQQDRVGPGLSCRPEFLEARHFNFNKAPWRLFFGFGHRVSDHYSELRIPHSEFSVERSKMVRLDQNSLSEVGTVVPPSPGAHCVLLESAQPWEGLTGVEDARAGGPGALDVAVRERGDAAERAQEVERGALGGEDGASSALNGKNRVATLHAGAILAFEHTAQRTIKRLKAAHSHGPAGENARSLGDDRGAPPHPWRGDPLGGEIAPRRIFAQGGVDQRLNGVRHQA